MRKLFTLALFAVASFVTPLGSTTAEAASCSTQHYSTWARKTCGSWTPVSLTITCQNSNGHTTWRSGTNYRTVSVYCPSGYHNLGYPY